MLKYSVDVSIVIPVYNAGEYIEECLNMITGQTHESIEIICVDDGSVDNSLELMRKYSEKDKRIKVISEENRGGGGARNRGLQEAVGKYVVFLDCDDFYEPDMIEKAFCRAEETQAEITIYKSDQYIMETDEYIFEDWAMIEWALPPYEPFKYREISTNIFRAFVGWPWDKLYLRKFVQSNNLQFQELRTTNDALFVFSALVLAERIATVREILIHRRVDTKDSLSKTREKSWGNFYKMLLALREMLKEHDRYDELEKDYINYALHFSLWNYNTLAEPTRTALKEILLSEWFAELGVLDKPQDYFYDQYEYGQYEVMLGLKEPDEE